MLEWLHTHPGQSRTNSKSRISIFTGVVLSLVCSEMNFYFFSGTLQQPGVYRDGGFNLKLQSLQPFLEEEHDRLDFVCAPSEHRFLTLVSCYRVLWFQ